jgi:hypothetical protein
MSFGSGFQAVGLLRDFDVGQSAVVKALTSRSTGC